jgi:hypothetical protein
MKLQKRLVDTLEKTLLTSLFNGEIPNLYALESIDKICKVWDNTRSLQEALNTWLQGTPEWDKLSEKQRKRVANWLIDRLSRQADKEVKKKSL